MWCNEIEPTVLAQMLIITLLTFTGALSRRKREWRANKQSTVPRVRRKVSDLMRELGENYVPRAYRMSGRSFWVLHAMLLPKLEYYLKRKQSRRSNKRKRGARNGLISTSIQAARNSDGHLPRDDLLKIVMDKDLRRPPPNLSCQY
eukprot:scaffold13572_cov56-Attheya_sp.AAC.5